MPAKKKAQSVDFEKALSELESLVERLEQGELSLEESVKTFERGIELTRACQNALRQAEQKVQILAQDTASELALKENQQTDDEDES